MESLTDLFVNLNSTAIEAISAINKTKAYIALVVDEKNKLIGTITDGDIRRGLLNGEKLDSSVQNFMHKDFLSIKDSDLSNINLEKILEQDSTFLMPILDEEGRVKELLQKQELIKKCKLNISTVVIMAGGKGKRLLPYTSDCPKPMVLINDKPMLEIILDKCINAGLNNFYISVNYLKEKIIDYFGDGKKWGVKIQYLYEKEPLGTAGSLKLLPEYSKISDSILILNGDIITDLNFSLLAEFHKKHQADITIAAKHKSYTIPFGVINTSGVELDNLIEKPTYDFLISAGIYLIRPFILKFIKDNEFYDMPDLVSLVKEKDFKVVTFPIHEYWFDVGRPETLEKVIQDWPFN
tara:strand:- start:126 stop:1181 length:1056 start_codon:yes stop_codon:yes gene_type:complete